jgi:hypothetical protein
MSDQPMSTPTPPLVARDPDEVLPPRRRRGLRPLTAVLAALVLVGAGFAGGIQAQKHYGGSSSSNSASSLRSALASRFGAGRTGGAGSFFGGGSAAGATGGTQEVGQVSLIKGSTIYVADFLGNTLKIEIPATAKVSETSQLSVKGIHPGDTVTATVTKLPGGNYKATTVTVTPSTTSGT